MFEGYHCMGPTPANTGSIITRQQLRAQERRIAKTTSAMQRLQVRNDRRKASGLPKIKSLATCKK